MNHGNRGWNGMFDGLRVPFAINAVLLGVLFIGLLHLLLALCTCTWDPDLGWWLLNPHDDQVGEVSIGKISYVSWAATPLRDVAISLGVWSAGGNDIACPAEPRFLLPWLVTLILWSFFAPAICRIAALRVARDETISIGEALRFGWQKFPTTFLTVIFVVVFLLILYLLVGVIGLVTAIPYVGPLLAVLLSVVTLLISLFALLILIGQIFGVHLMAAGIAAEASDGLDGLSRAINYIYSRPWNAIVHYALVIFSMLLLLMFGDLFYGLLHHSSTMLTNARNTSAPFHRVATAGTEHTGWYADHIEDYVSPQDRAGDHWVDHYYGELIQENADVAHMRVVSQDVSGVWTTFPPRQARLVQFTKTSGSGFEAAPAPLSVISEQIQEVGGWSRFCYALFYYILILVKYLLVGYVVAYVLAGTTTSYFLLRKTVDGTETDEVYFEEEEYELPPLTEPSAPAAPEPPAPEPPAPEPPAPESPPAPPPAPEPPPAPAPEPPPAAPEGAQEKPVVPPPPPDTPGTRDVP